MLRKNAELENQIESLRFGRTFISLPMPDANDANTKIVQVFPPKTEQMENTLENAIKFMNDRYGQDIEEILISYAASVRPVVVLPSYRLPRKYADEYEQGVDVGFDMYRCELRRLNPDLAFSESK